MRPAQETALVAITWIAILLFGAIVIGLLVKLLVWTWGTAW